MNALVDLHFLRPWWLLALGLAPMLPWLLRRGGESAALRRLVDAVILPYLVETGSRRRDGLAAGAVLAWCLAVLAMAGPTWQRLPQPVMANRSAQVLVVSMSRHMLAQDQAPNRLARVRYKMHALLKANRSGQNALVAYAGEAFTVAPLTRDANALTDLLDALRPDTMPVDGDNAAAGIRRATRLLKDAHVGRGSIVVIDDHADTQALDAARAASKAGMEVSVLATGTRKGAPVPASGGGFETDAQGHVVMARRDAASLRALAAAGGGRYVAMTADAGDVRQLARSLPSQPGARDAHHAARVWQDNGAWLLLPLVLLLALGFRRGSLLVLPLLLLPLYAPTAHASGWRDAWLTRDQQAARALAQGHAKKAEALARDPGLRGTAAYRAGHYAAAAKAFASAPGARNQYNLGNALARLHRYKDAVKAYDEALANDPGMADAKANRQAVLDWMRKQRRASSDDGKGAKGQGAGKRQSGSSPAKKNPTTGKHGQGNGQRKGNAGQGRQDASRDGNRGSANPSASSGKPGDNATQNPTGKQGAKPGHPASAASVARARAALKKQMDRQLQGMKAYDLGRARPAPDGKGKPLSAPMREALRKVPDDPGGLLRNKFMLEYQRRRQRGDASTPANPDGGS